MRRDAATAQTKEYRLFKGLFTLDGGQKKELQAALDAAPPKASASETSFTTTGSR